MMAYAIIDIRNWQILSQHGPYLAKFTKIDQAFEMGFETLPFFWTLPSLNLLRTLINCSTD